MEYLAWAAILLLFLTQMLLAGIVWQLGNRLIGVFEAFLHTCRPYKEQLERIGKAQESHRKHTNAVEDMVGKIRAGMRPHNVEDA